MTPLAIHRRILPLALIGAIVAIAEASFPGRSLSGPASLPTGFVDTPIATSLNMPTSIAEVPDPASVASRRVLYVEQITGNVGLVADGIVFAVGTVPNVTTDDRERGLLGIAVDPRWPAHPYLYVHYTDGRSGHHVAISRFRLTGDLNYQTTGQLLFNASSRYDLRADFPDDFGNHNGGTVRFGPDGMLYVSLGDDASYCPAQDIRIAAGKILRLDVTRLPATGTGPAPYALLAAPGNPYANHADSIARLVWTSGLRNPFRFNMDPLTGALVIGDVGLDAWEELDLDTGNGMNMGWPIYEGPDFMMNCSVTAPSPPTAPIAWYDHATGSAILGGPRYRRPATGGLRFPAAYEGDIFYLDYYTGLMRRLKHDGAAWVPAPAPGQPNANDWGSGFDMVPDMVEFSNGTLWYCRQTQGPSQSGEIRRIAYAGPADTTTEPVPALVLHAPHPNPSSGPATIGWTQVSAGAVTLTLFAADGRRVRTLADGETFVPGPQSRVWDGLDEAGRRAPPGLYFVRLEARGDVRHARLTLLSAGR